MIVMGAALLFVVIGVTISAFLTNLGARITSPRAHDMEKVRTASIKELEQLIDAGKKGTLRPEEQIRLSSALMSYVMTATSKRLVAKYLDDLEQFNPPLDASLISATREVFEQRFGARGTVEIAKDTRIIRTQS